MKGFNYVLYLEVIIVVCYLVFRQEWLYTVAITFAIWEMGGEMLRQIEKYRRDKVD